MNEQTPTVVRGSAVQSGDAGESRLAESLWLYGVPIAGSGHAYHAIPSPTALVAEPAPVATTVVQLRQSDVSVPTVDPPVHQQQNVNVAVNWRALVEQYGDWNVNIMLRIMACESSGDPLAVSPDGRNVGLLQVNLVHGWSTAQLQDPTFNIAAAHDVYLSQGYSAWSCY